MLNCFSFLWLALGFALAAQNEDLKAHLEELRVKYNSTAAVGYVSNSEALCAYAAAGFAQELNKAPAFDVDGRQSFGSLTKSMTVTLMAILLSENKIRGQIVGEKSWETTLGMIFPASEYPDYGLRNSPFEHVTLAALSSMFGGIPSDPDTPLRYWDFDIPGVGLRTQRRNLTIYGLHMAPTSRWPATEYRYSDLSYVILGHVIEESTNTLWEDLLIERVLEPLGIPKQDWPFGPVGVFNWGHVYLNQSMPMYPCDPEHPPEFITQSVPQYRCDNAPNIGPGGTYSGSILESSKYFRWVLNCAAGLSTQSILPLSQAQCIQIQTPFGLVDKTQSEGTWYGFGWIYSTTQLASGKNITYLSYEGSNLLNIAGVFIYPAPISTILWASTNGGGINTPNEQDLILEISSYLATAVSNGYFKC